MLTHVIVPLDGSKLANTALAHALKLLGTSGEITLVTVLRQPDEPLSDFYPVTVRSQPKDYDEVFKEAIIQAQNYLNYVAADIQANYPYEVATRVEIGDAATLIVERAQELHVDAIVMSTHGRSGLTRLMFGSVTQKVLALSDRPVVVIPAAAVSEASKSTVREDKTLPAPCLNRSEFYQAPCCASFSVPVSVRRSISGRMANLVEALLSGGDLKYFQLRATSAMILRRIPQH